MPKEKYNHQEVEKQAQKKWESLSLYETNLNDTEKEPYYLLFEFPYPSGDLHIGHWYAYAVTDIYARLQKMRGKNVLFPIGFDAFGLPAENAAIKNGANPRTWTLENIERMRKQISSIGTSVDWSKEVVTCDPSYYKFTQWLFAHLLERGLAYRKEASVKWCPKDATVLANEQVIDGRCERCDSEVEEKLLTQWFMKITAYADKLLEGLDTLSWREDIKEAQRQWIGKSEGAEIRFKIKGGDEEVEVFTTRPDTIFGATYLVLAPEHLLLEKLLLQAENPDEIRAYQNTTKKKTERERSENKEKTGVELKGIQAINPATKEAIPVWVADYVLASYGTGAVMAVPAHDERDAEFAKRHHLPSTEVVAHQAKERHPEGVYRRIAIAIVENAKGEILLQFTKKGDVETVGLPGGGVDEGEDIETATKREVIEETGYTDFKTTRFLGTIETTYFNQVRNIYRQALASCYVFTLSTNSQQEPEFSELEKQAEITHRWVTKDEAQTLLRSGQANSGEDDPFFERYLADKDICYTGDGVLINSGDFSGKNNREAFDDIVAFVGGEKTTNYRMRDWLVSRQRYWGCPIPVVYDPEGKPHYVGDENLPWLLPEDVDFTPTGKAPLASSKELHDRVEKIFGKGWTPEYDTLDTFVDSSWYYTRYLSPKDDTQFADKALMEKWLPVERYSGGSEHTTMHLLYARFFHKALHDLGLVPYEEPFTERYNRGLILGSDGQKMSKRWGNVINPDEMVERFGADAVRAYLAFIGPYNEAGHYPWNLDGVESMRKLLNRVYALQEKVAPDAETNEEILRALAKTTAKVSEDSDRFKFNTALSALMVLTSLLEKEEKLSKEVFATYVRLFAPFAPHVTERLWSLLNQAGSVHMALWPTFDASLLEDDEVTIVVQINGKRKGEVTVPKEASQEEVEEAVRNLPKLAGELTGSPKVIYVKGRIINFVLPK